MKKLAKNKSGATTVEFALLSPLFLMMIFSFVETGWLMTKVVMLEQAVSQASRSIYTGQAPTKSSLEQEICADATIFADCERNINIETFLLADFTDAPTDEIECLDSADTDFTPSVKYETGTSASIMLLRVCITTEVLIPGIGLGLTLNKDEAGRMKIVASTAFMHEPY